MKKWLWALFSENGSVSMLRVMSLIVCLSGCYLAIARGDEEIGMVSVLLGTAFGAKLGQKIVETKSDGATRG